MIFILICNVKTGWFEIEYNVQLSTESVQSEEGSISAWMREYLQKIK